MPKSEAAKCEKERRRMFDYKSAMESGHAFNKIVAMRLESEGISAEVPEFSFAQSKEEIKDYTLNDKDIIVGDEIIEVKSRNLFFTDNPSSFPYDELIVDTVSGYEAKEKKPLAYVMVSQKTGGMFIIPTAFSASWKIEKKYDRERKHEDFFYLVSKSFGRPFLQLVNKLKGAA